jgi:hypothetical protein
VAVLFFKIPENYYLYWIIISFIISFYLFSRKFEHEKIEEIEEKSNKLYLPL